MSCPYVKLRRCFKSRLGASGQQAQTARVSPPWPDNQTPHRALQLPRALASFASIVSIRYSLLSHDLIIATLIPPKALPELGSERDLTPSD
ncbi:hypothetical protein N7516_009002 [Penicillium verrucosum]|uniref:uncharacterized protein n=1 Tax=Penicillium verrucosum TaxID=60171 RepID=UPI002544F04C|nr:uncharacterized protein N7516_009002 [Penicillium verrucosum]KAJ5927229.1 hypothetical protein N7516_009002 [Penicillium verrucosum]